MTIVSVKCPQCACSVLWTAEQLYKPFCSERCKLIDLGEWFAEEKRIANTTPLLIDEYDPIIFVGATHSPL